MSKFSLAVALLLAATSAAYGQTQIEWKQVLDTPKGVSIPRDRADVLGVELGDTFDVAKGKMETLLKEGDKRDSYIEEFDRTFHIRITQSSTVVSASFVSIIEMVREMPGTRLITDRMKTYFSAPSSGNQVIGIERTISYHADADQPRISELVGQLKAKMKFEPQFNGLNETGHYVWQFNNGQPVPRGPGRNKCNVSHGLEQESNLRTVNETGDCDGLLIVQVNYGLSRDHAKYISITLTDNDRTKANLTANFAYVHDYLRSFQQRSRGVAPKL